MSSSGYSSYTIYRDGLITLALRKIRVLQDGQAASSNDITNANDNINILLKNWQVRALILALYQQIAVPLVTNQTSYTIGPVGADVIIERPIQVVDGSFVSDGAGNDTTLRIISRQEYDQITNKTTSGVVDGIYWKPAIDITPAPPIYQTSPSIGWGTLFLFLPSVNNAQTVYINTRRAVQDVINGGDEFDLPQEWFLALLYGLAALLADDYEVPEDRCMRLQKQADMYLENLLEWQRELYQINYGERRQQINRTLAAQKA